MKVYTVHAPPESGRNPLRDYDRIVFVKDGFCWPALFVPLLWLLWNRLWLVLLGWLVAALVIMAVAALTDLAEVVTTVLALAFAFWFAAEANGLRRWTLERKGWRFVGVASGGGLGDCERDFFTRRGDLTGQLQPRRGPPDPLPPRRKAVDNDPVIGLFPRAE